MKSSGFTLIELMIVLAIVGVFAAVIAPRITGDMSEDKKYTCKAGYKFTFDGGQILDENRGGIRCFDQ